MIQKCGQKILCCSLLLLFIAGSITAQAAAAVTTPVSNQELIDALVGSNTTLQNFTVSGNPAQIGIYSGLSELLGFDDGVLLSTGFASNAIKDELFEGEMGGGASAELSAINGGHTTADTVSIEFDMVSDTDSLSFQYLFASSEWDQNPQYNDVFALYVNGVNLALLPGTSTKVSIQDILTASGFPSGKTPPTGGFFVNTMDFENFNFSGRSVLLNCVASVTPGESNHIKITLADSGDDTVDSAVFLKGSSLVGEAPTEPGNIAPTTVQEEESTSEPESTSEAPSESTTQTMETETIDLQGNPNTGGEQTSIPILLAIGSCGALAVLLPVIQRKRKQK